MGAVEFHPRRMAHGFIYILTNSSMPGLLKIGKTTRLPRDRAAELSAVTGIAAPFEVAYSRYVTDCDKVELLIHGRLGRSRYRGDREFFQVSLDEATEVVSEICERFVLGLSATSQSKTHAAAVICSDCGLSYTVTMVRYEKSVVCPRCGHGQVYPVNWTQTPT